MQAKLDAARDGGRGVGELRTTPAEAEARPWRGRGDSRKILDWEPWLIQIPVQILSRKPVAMSHVSFTDLRQHMAKYFDQVAADREPLVVTRQGGKGNLVIMSEEEFAGWQETVHLLSSPRNAERLQAAIRQLRAGGARERELIVPDALPPA
jgi:antitoxin YefM